MAPIVTWSLIRTISRPDLTDMVVSARLGKVEASISVGLRGSAVGRHRVGLRRTKRIDAFQQRENVNQSPDFA
jgi:hypothetical protein